MVHPPSKTLDEILADARAELLDFEAKGLHGTVTIHVGDGDYELKADRHYPKRQRQRVTNTFAKRR